MRPSLISVEEEDYYYLAIGKLRPLLPFSEDSGGTREVPEAAPTSTHSRYISSLLAQIRQWSILPRNNTFPATFNKSLVYRVAALVPGEDFNEPL